MERINWRNVKIYGEDGVEVDEEIRLEKLKEYRKEESISGPFWFVDPTTHGTNEGVDEDMVFDPFHDEERPLWNAGPSVDEIDWTGIDEARYEVVIDSISEPYGKDFSFVTVHFHFEQNGMSTGDGGQSERITVYGLDSDEAIREHCQSELDKMNEV